MLRKEKSWESMRPLLDEFVFAPHERVLNPRAVDVSQTELEPPESGLTSQVAIIIELDMLCEP